MADFDASTPQLKVIKKLMDAYLSFDMKNVESLLSKNYQYQPAPTPEITDLPKEAEERRVGRFKAIFAALSTVEVIYHEVIEAPGKVVLHVTGVLSTVFGTTLNYETIVTYTLVEEDGELKILHCKDFANPQQRIALIAGTIKAAAERAAA